MAEHDPSFDDDDELELEPLDPEIVKHQQERTKRRSRAAEDAADINAAYDDGNLGDPVDLERLRQFRFTTQHLLIATAVVAMVMTLIVRLDGCMGLFVTGCVALGAGWWFVLREENRRLAEIEASRERFARRLAAERAVEDGEMTPAVKAKIDAENFERINREWERENTAEPGFKFSFSMKELLGAFTVAAVILGLAQILGFQTAALLLGFIALAGLLAQTFGVELPPLMVLGWWFLLVLYILVSLWATMSGPEAG